MTTMITIMMMIIMISNGSQDSVEHSNQDVISNRPSAWCVDDLKIEPSFPGLYSS